MGEQSAKGTAWRGNGRRHIQPGTDGRKPMGMAEVSLTLGGVGDESLARRGCRGRL